MKLCLTPDKDRYRSQLNKTVFFRPAWNGNVFGTWSALNASCFGTPSVTLRHSFGRSRRFVKGSETQCRVSIAAGASAVRSGHGQMLTFTRCSLWSGEPLRSRLVFVSYAAGCRSCILPFQLCQYTGLVSYAIGCRVAMPVYAVDQVE